MADRIRTAIFGGTFNPIHNGHIAIARAVVESGLADELWLMVTPQNPWKRNMQLMPDSYRLQLVKSAVSAISGVRASGYEFSLPKPSYTANTLRSLERDYPERAFSLIIGADNWVKFSNWYDSQYILEHYHIIVYPRPGFDTGAITSGYVSLLDCPLIDVSSTEIRERLASGLPVNGMVPDEILGSLALYQTDGIS